MILNFFLEKSSNQSHKKITKKSRVYTLGGLFFLISILILKVSIFLKIGFILIYLIGLLADKNILKSAYIRFLIQLTFTFFIIYFSKIIISETRIIFLDQLIKYQIVGLIFTVLCILILINGTNFIDGVNLNMIGYYLIINLILLYLSLNNNIYVNTENLKITLFFLCLVCIFNMSGSILSGDSGSYLISLFWGLELISFATVNKFISPFFIVLLFWYPAFENFFSIIRKINLSRSILNPDFFHFHQLLYLNLLRFNRNKLFSNNLSGLIINIYNLIVFLIGANFYSNTQALIALIIFNIIVYLSIYFRLLNKILKN